MLGSESSIIIDRCCIFHVGQTTAVLRLVHLPCSLCSQSINCWHLLLHLLLQGISAIGQKKPKHIRNIPTSSWIHHPCQTVQVLQFIQPVPHQTRGTATDRLSLLHLSVSIFWDGVHTHVPHSYQVQFYPNAAGMKLFLRRTYWELLCRAECSCLLG